jgi:hypothetical protein
MQLTGVVRNGVIVLENGEKLPEGTRVGIGVLEPASPPESLGTFLLKSAGTVQGLPPDMAEHDHYLHGRPKR